MTLAQKARDLAGEGIARDEALRRLLKAVALHQLEGTPALVNEAIAEAYGPDAVADTGAVSDPEEAATPAPWWTCIFDDEHEALSPCSSRASCPPKRAPALLPGLLRRGHTGLLVARSKSYKSWTMVALAVAVATGSEWMGRRCKRGRVLFIDPEIDPRSAPDMFHAVSERMGVSADEVDRQVAVLSLRGRVTRDGDPVTINYIADAMRDAANSGDGRDRGVDLVIIDSCSAVLVGDENASMDVRRFHAQCLRISEITGAAVMCVHHEGKAQSGDRDAIARGRGSSAWGDTFDLVLSLVEIFPPSGAASDYLEGGGRAFSLECAAIREFASVPPLHLICRHPMLEADTEGVTDEWKPKSAQQAAGRASGESRKAKAAERANSCVCALLSHMYRQNTDSREGIPATEAAEICKRALGVSVTTNTLKGYVDSSGWLDVLQKGERRWCVVPRHPRPTIEAGE